MVRLPGVMALGAFHKLQGLDMLLAAAVASTLAGYSLFGCCTHGVTCSLLDLLFYYLLIQVAIARRQVFQLELAECSPAVIFRVGLAVTWPLVQVGPALGAKAGAVLSA